MARFSDNSDSTILKFLKFLTKLLCTNSIVLFCLLVAILHYLLFPVSRVK